MNQKKVKILKREKLKAQAEIVYTASQGMNVEEGKLHLISRAVVTILEIDCPERTKYLKEAIALAEELKLRGTAFKLAVLGLSKKDEKEYFMKICEKHKGMENEALLQE